MPSYRSFRNPLLHLIVRELRIIQQSTRDISSSDKPSVIHVSSHSISPSSERVEPIRFSQRTGQRDCLIRFREILSLNANRNNPLSSFRNFQGASRDDFIRKYRETLHNSAYDRRSNDLQFLCLDFIRIWRGGFSGIVIICSSGGNIKDLSEAVISLELAMLDCRNADLVLFFGPDF